ncbi:DNA-deoxyinosine glycosylase [Mycolicibacterium pulveris]|uniref:DNA-deoxyinosine glycosylase n=1 Tax=Mycolicibacterium pulveris TaxID=36813 RepID=UPI0013D6501F|nr:DNA-deoxyinosine glycosylase [Mycolicibacterium pulveris]MCV6981031.1 DNA-deoxyinosine glycosylase [Mycolicibacterium pulveris]
MTTPLLHGLPPIIGEGAHTLILGNMPSVMSLAAQQYYGNPRNAFWRITGEVLGFGADDPYPDRVAALTAHGFAVWDVLRSCRRVGSLDSAVQPDSMVPNGFQQLFDEQPGIGRVLFNGAAAEKNYHRLVGAASTVRYRRLPSTSPAQTMRYADKLAAWREGMRQ